MVGLPQGLICKLNGGTACRSKREIGLTRFGRNSHGYGITKGAIARLIGTYDIQTDRIFSRQKILMIWIFKGASESITKRPLPIKCIEIRLVRKLNPITAAIRGKGKFGNAILSMA